jgi:hypothetical protein
VHPPRTTARIGNHVRMLRTDPFPLSAAARLVRHTNASIGPSEATACVRGKKCTSTTLVTRFTSQWAPTATMTAGPASAIEYPRHLLTETSSHRCHCSVFALCDLLYRTGQQVVTQGHRAVSDGNFEILMAAGGFGYFEACSGSTVNNPQFYGQVRFPHSIHHLLLFSVAKSFRIRPLIFPLPSHVVPSMGRRRQHE